jgi:hypothetical protein
MLVLVSLTFFISWAPLNIFNIILDLTNAFKVLATERSIEDFTYRWTGLDRTCNFCTDKKENQIFLIYKERCKVIYEEGLPNI